VPDSGKVILVRTFYARRLGQKTRPGLIMPGQILQHSADVKRFGQVLQHPAELF